MAKAYQMNTSSGYTMRLHIMRLCSILSGRLRPTYEVQLPKTSTKAVWRAWWEIWDVISREKHMLLLAKR